MRVKNHKVIQKNEYVGWVESWQTAKQAQALSSDPSSTHTEPSAVAHASEPSVGQVETGSMELAIQLV